MANGQRPPGIDDQWEKDAVILVVIGGVGLEKDPTTMLVSGKNDAYIGGQFE